jgi:hypothetical protein
MDDTRRELVRSWLTKAASDLRSARVLGLAEEAPLDTAIYHFVLTLIPPAARP